MKNSLSCYNYYFLRPFSRWTWISQYQNVSNSPCWVLLELRMIEVVSTEAVRHAKLYSNHHHQQSYSHFLQAGFPCSWPTNVTGSQHLREYKWTIMSIMIFSIIWLFCNLTGVNCCNFSMKLCKNCWIVLWKPVKTELWFRLAVTRTHKKTESAKFRQLHMQGMPKSNPLWYLADNLSVL